jgi:hypothetical protein
MSKNSAVKMSPPISRHIGLGLEPDKMKGLGQQPLEILQCGMNLLPQLEWTTMTVELPITQAQIASTFGPTVPLVGVGANPPGVASVDSTFLQNSSTLQCDMLCMAYGVQLLAEPISFAQVGVAVPATATTPVWSADAFTQLDLVNGALGPLSTECQPAIFQYGRSAQLAMWELAQAYKFVWTMYQRQIAVEEMVRDVAYFGSLSQVFGASDSDQEIQTYAKKANANYRQLGSPTVFQPAYSRRVGQVQTANTVTPGSPTALFHATNDFTLAATTIGGIAVQNTGPGNGQRRRLAKPLLLEAGINIGLNLEVVDEPHYQAFAQYLDISEGVGGLTAIVSFDTQMNGLSTGTGNANTGMEQSSDAVAVYSTQQVNTNRTIFKAGSCSIGVQLYGWELWGCWKEWACNNWQGCITVPGTAPRSDQTAMSGLPRR